MCALLFFTFCFRGNVLDLVFQGTDRPEVGFQCVVTIKVTADQSVKKGMSLPNSATWLWLVVLQMYVDNVNHRIKKHCIDFN